MSGRSAIYRGRVTHDRQLPRDHSFSYSLSLLALDLDDLPEVFDDHLLVSARRLAPWRFARRDYHGPADQSLKRSVRDTIARELGIRPSGPIVLLTQIRSFGFIFNPVSFYFAYEGDEVAAMMAEITNTPWLERHHYVLGDAHRRADGGFDGSFDKAFHISPFMGMNQSYRWIFSPLGERLDVRMETHEEGRAIFATTMGLERQALDRSSLNTLLLRQPFMTLRVALAIYWQALRLKWKGLAFHDHPKTMESPLECSIHE